jgi:thioredoxin-dependent peroxiredoxin
MLAIGDKAPDFTLKSDTGETISLSELTGQTVVLYFYPKDNTSGCTRQACDVRDAQNSFEAKGVKILGISKDSLKSHAQFRENHHLNFPLLSDETGEVCEEYGTWAEKSLYGQKYKGIDRSTFIIDKNGLITHIWRGVSVPGHIEEILGTL